MHYLIGLEEENWFQFFFCTRFQFDCTTGVQVHCAGPCRCMDSDAESICSGHVADYVRSGLSVIAI
jgi:hypothetical protein